MMHLDVNIDHGQRHMVNHACADPGAIQLGKRWCSSWKGISSTN